ncbi:MAG: mechanosensitive ion channel, partial [Moraxellaceae bacterium]|nr:mechanosensitive ion channel [Moraxellaceae bacterium]
MPFVLPELLHEGFIRDLIITFVFGSVLLGIRYALRRAILRRDALEPDMKRRWLVSVRNATFLLFLMGIMLIWAREIQTVALSMVAIAAALVLATREIILCLLGSLYRTSTNAYSIGDRIEI